MGQQILLIDDSTMLRRIASIALGAQPARYEVVSATRASEGFARACGGEVAVILIDERMIGHGETDFCRRLLGNPCTSTLPVILMTNRHTEAAKLWTLPENVVDLLSKPFAPEQLVGAVNAIMALAKRRADFGQMRRTLYPGTGGFADGLYTDQPVPPDTSESRVLPASGATPSWRLGETSVRAALQSVAAAGATGVLKFQPSDGIATEVFVDGGHVVLVTTRDGATYSRDAANFLPARLSPAALQDAAAEQDRTGMPFLLSLGARGLVSKAAGVTLLGRFGQRQFARLWTVPTRSLHITFEPLEAPPGYTLRLEPIHESVDEWLLGTLRMLTCEDIGSEARHQGLVGTPGLLRRGDASLGLLKLNETESAFVRQINGRRDLPTIANNLGATPEEIFLLVHRFRCLETLEYRPAPLPFVVTPRTNTRRVLPLKR